MPGKRGNSGLSYWAEGMPKKGRLLLHRKLATHENWAEAIMPADVEAGEIEQEVSKKPLVVLAGLCAVAVLGLALRLFSLQVVSGERNLVLAEGNRLRQKVIRAPRGVIYDRHETVLARNQASFDLTVIPALLPRLADDRQGLYERIAKLGGYSVEEIRVKAEAKGLRQTQPVLVVSGLEREKALTFDQQAGELTGFSLDVNPLREYLDGGVLSHLFGYTGRISEAELEKHREYLPTDFIGKLGIEQSYEEVLKGVAGSERTEVDAEGRPVKLLASKPVTSGLNLVLSISHPLQLQLTEALSKQVERSGSRRGAAVALDPRSGEVLAMVSLPGYDSNLFSKGISEPDYRNLADDPAQPLFNKAIGGAYPTGSIIKPIVASAALQEKVVTPATVVEDTGQIEVPNRYDPTKPFIFRSYDAGGLGIVNLRRALALSSNVYFYTIGGGFGNIEGLGVRRLVDYYQKFGLGRATGIDVPNETSGRLPDPDWKKRIKKEDWYTGDTYNLAVGQGDLAASPLQMAAATSAIANGGTLYKPRVVKRIVDGQGKVVKELGPEVVNSGLASVANLAVVREGMRQVVSSGTACCMIEEQVPVAVAAKTGTAETDPGGKRKPHAWFTAFAPYSDPKIVIVALVENSGEGAEFAAPAVREVLAWCFTQPDGCVK